MEAEQKIGTVGTIDESFTGGIASVKGAANVALPKTTFGLTLKLGIVAEADLDSTDLIEYLAAKAGGPVPEAVAKFIEGALSGIK